ncbi:MAG: hypothetical protein RLZZ164_89 [Actinomycetota bacterium]
MGWLVATCWIAAVLVSVAFLGWIGYTLIGKLGRLGKAAEPLAKLAQKLSEDLAKPIEYQAPKDNLSDDPATHILALKRLQVKRTKRAAERQRRLVARLKQQNPGEQL